MNADLGRVWDANYSKVIHLEAGEDGLTLILPDGDSMVLSDRTVRDLRRTLQRYERNHSS